MRRFKKALCGTLAVGLMLPAVVIGSGSEADAATGTWKHDKNGWWYSYSAGKYAQDEWVKDGGKWYYFKKDGYMATGWVQYKGQWYYFGKNGAMVTGWKKIDGKWYFFKANGTLHKGWKQYGDNWYYLGGDYAMVTGWKKISGNWYHFEETGEMTVGWLEWDENTYYFNEDGEMVTGEITIDGVDYIFDDDGALIESGIGGSWTDPVATRMTAEEKEILRKAIDADEYLPEEGIEGMACLGSQVVAGTNYRFLCKLSGDTEYMFVILTVYYDLEGNATITGWDNCLRAFSISTLPGGYKEPVSIFLDSDDIVIDKALKAYDIATRVEGVSYKPLAVLATQEVSGMNYVVLSYVKTITLEPEEGFAAVEVYEPLDEDPYVISQTRFLPADMD